MIQYIQRPKHPDISFSIFVAVSLDRRHKGRDSVSNHQAASRLFTQPFIQAQIKENIEAPRHWSLQMASNAKNVSIWWRHHSFVFIRQWSICYCQYRCERVISANCMNNFFISLNHGPYIGLSVFQHLSSVRLNLLIPPNEHMNCRCYCPYLATVLIS